MRSELARSFPVSRVAVCIFLPFIGLVLLVGGLHGVVSFGLLPILETIRTRAWVPAEAWVEDAGTRTARWPLHRGFVTIETRFRYVHGSTGFEGTRYDTHNGLVPAAEAEAALAQMQRTPAMTVWVNPRAPMQAVAHRELRPQVLALVLPSLLIGLGGAMVLYRGMVAWTREAADENEEGEEAEAPAIDTGRA